MKIELGKDYEVELNNLIQKCYFENNNGKLNNKVESIVIKKEDPTYIMLKGLNNMTVRIHNDNLIEGTTRFVVDECEDYVKLIPCNIYCITENNKYSFY